MQAPTTLILRPYRILGDEFWPRLCCFPRRVDPKSCVSRTSSSASPARAKSASGTSPSASTSPTPISAMGYYPVPLPNGMGVEASGVIDAVGDGVTGFAPGDRVTYTGSPLGAYSTERVMPIGSLIKLPDAISHETAAAMTMRGLTAAYLLRRINPWLKSGDTILLHAAAGGVGLIVSQWAKLLGLRVIGTVSTEEKAAIARAHGCDEIIFYSQRGRRRAGARADRRRGRRRRLRHRRQGHVRRLARVAARRGLLVCCGTASGPVPPIDALQLAMKGLALRHPSGAGRLYRRSGRARRPGRPALRPCRGGPHQDRDQPALRARGRRPGASRSRGAQDHRLIDLRRSRRHRCVSRS